ncbi:Rieske 2Fe-2S domain-containing protein [Nocardia paucivorans]|uniref:Rieske 2Fe-2S domain-containing protein n=1 Tax=Nocardia paucivorans TaxID=114259 RepID=UPI00030BB92D|nr:Rieske 2Fe-2S domain-containing protein [Nocardia paucivorans]
MSEPQVAWEQAGTLDDLWEGEIREVTIGKESILLAHLHGGEIRAYQSMCPHSRFPLDEGELDGSVLTCAAHGWEFDLETGEGINPRNCRLFGFAVRRDGDRISVAIPRDDRPHYNTCRGDRS